MGGEIHVIKKWIQNDPFCKENVYVSRKRWENALMFCYGPCTVFSALRIHLILTQQFGWVLLLFLFYRCRN